MSVYNNWSTLLNRINQLNKNIKDPFFREYLIDG